MLLVLNGLPQSRVPTLAGDGGRIAVTIGWHDGDVEPLSLLRGRSWERFPLPSGYGRRALDPNKPELATRNLLLGHYIDAWQVRQRLKEGADVSATDKKGLSILHIYGAADLDIFTMLLDAGADPCAVTPDGDSVLDWVFNDGRATATHLRLLLDRGAAFSKAGTGWDPPLHALARRSIYERGRLAELRDMLTLLLEKGYHINAPDAQGRPPLWAALMAHAQELMDFVKFQKERGYIGGVWDYEHDKVAMLFLEHGADPNARLSEGLAPLIPAGATPLMVRRYDDARLVKALLKAGADPTLTSDEGKTALDYARLAADQPDEPDRAAAQSVVTVLERALRRAPQPPKH